MTLVMTHVIAYVQTLNGNPPGAPDKATDDRQWNPFTWELHRTALTPHAFRAAMISKGFLTKKRAEGNYYLGLRFLKQ